MTGEPGRLGALHIAICGSGPAGLAAALLLHRAGHRIDIYERFDAPRPVGSGLILQPTGLGVLAELGLAEAIFARGAVINRLFGRAAPSGRIVLDVRYSARGTGWSGLAVHRSALFDVLYQAAMDAGLSVHSSTPVSGSDMLNGKRVLTDSDGRHLGAFDLVVDAMGSRSPLRPPYTRSQHLSYGAFWANIPISGDLGFAPDALEQRYFRASRMAGVLPVGQRQAGGPQEAAFFWSIRQQDVEHWRSRGLAAWKDEVCSLWPQCAPLLESITSPDDLTLAHYEHFTLARPYGQALVHIGDCAHSTSPQLGQGANMALLDALALARALAHSQNVVSALSDYARMRRWHVLLFQAGSAIFTPFYQSDSRVLPFLRDWLAAPVSRMPVADAMLAKLVSGLTVAPLAGRSFQPFRQGPLALNR